MVDPRKIAVDIGSTIVKVAHTEADGRILKQEFRPRDFEVGIARQVEDLLEQLNLPTDSADVLVCSSANGGLRVGIICLTEHYSGAALRNQVLGAGANPIFVDNLDSADGSLQSVDILLIGGGIDCDDARPIRERLARLDLSKYHFKTLVYAGNRFLSIELLERFPNAVIVDNPLATGLRAENTGVFETLRRAYLDDLVYKEGVSELRGNLGTGIRSTPEVVNQGFRRAVFNQARIKVAGPSAMIDIGGATTDLHYTVEIVSDDSDDRPFEGSSVARYVFTDLGIAFSRDSALQQLRNHKRLFEFLGHVGTEDLNEVYQMLREGEYDPSPQLLSYACLFLALDRFVHGHGPGLPSADLRKISHLILTGGAAQNLTEAGISRVLNLFFNGSANAPEIVIDENYQMWVEGITWDEGQ